MFGEFAWYQLVLPVEFEIITISKLVVGILTFGLKPRTYAQSGLWLSHFQVTGFMEKKVSTFIFQDLYLFFFSFGFFILFDFFFFSTRNRTRAYMCVRTHKYACVRTVCVCTIRTCVHRLCVLCVSTTRTVRTVCVRTVRTVRTVCVRMRKHVRTHRAVCG